MRNLIILLAVLFSTSSLSQSDSTGFKRLLIGVSVSPDYCYRTLKNNDGSAISDVIIKMREDNEDPKLGYTAGLSVIYNISEKIGFESGIHYSTKGEMNRLDNLTYGDMIDPRYGFTYAPQTPSPEKVTIFYHYNYLDIPFRAIFSFGKKRMRFISGVGITTNVFLNARQISISEYANGDSNRSVNKRDYDFRPINLSPSISAGIALRLGEKINLRCEPTFRYGLIKIIDTPVTSYLWSGGLNISCFYAIK